MIKILFFIPSFSGGGAEKVLCNLVNNMDHSRFDITVQTVYHCDAKQYLVPSVHYRSIFPEMKSLFLKAANGWYRFCTEFGLTYPLYIRDDYDIEVAFLECGATKVMAASTNRKAKKVAWVHCDLSRKSVYSEKTADQYRKYDSVVCVSKDVQEGFRRLYGNQVRTEVLNTVIDDIEIRKRSEESIIWERDNSKKQLLAVGRLSKQKDFSHLINTCSKLADAGHQFHLTILGEGPEREELQRQIETLRLSDYVKLAGYQPNPYPYIRAADLVVCSSRYEGISSVVQEALILGTPVVTTPCTGMKELLGESEYGLVVENSIDGLYQGVSELLNDPKRLLHYKEVTKEKSKQISRKSSVQKTERYFLYLMNQ